MARNQTDFCMIHIQEKPIVIPVTMPYASQLKSTMSLMKWESRSCLSHLPKHTSHVLHVGHQMLMLRIPTALGNVSPAGSFCREKLTQQWIDLILPPYQVTSRPRLLIGEDLASQHVVGMAYSGSSIVIQIQPKRYSQQKISEQRPDT